MSKAAAARDRRFIAAYSLATAGRPNRSVMMTVAADGTWRLDLQGGALGGSTDIAIVARTDGQYQCVTSANATDKSCVKLASASAKLSATVDPRVQYPFTSWLNLLTDRTAALTVSQTQPLQNATGACFSVEATTVSTTPPIESSVFCYTDDATLTAARAAFGTLTITGTPGPAPNTVTMPGAIVDRAPLPLTAPPQPSAPAASPTTPAPAGSGANRSAKPAPKPTRSD